LKLQIRNPKIQIRASRFGNPKSRYVRRAGLASLALVFLLTTEKITPQHARSSVAAPGGCRTAMAVAPGRINSARCPGPPGASAPTAKPAAAAEQAMVPLGFSPQSYVDQQRWEQRYLELPDAAHCGKYLRRLTARPHVAGTPGDRRVTQFIYDEFKRAGLKPEIVEYRVLLSYPKKVAVELVEPARVRLANPEPALPQDKDTRVRDPLVKMPWNGYSPSADLTAPVVYVNYGNAEDYEQLEKLGISVKGKIVLARYFHGYRGGKSLEAEQRGAAGVLVYSDPADDGASKGPVYPNGPWGPPGHFQRGSVVYDFQIPGDPLTPGWASTPAARRLAPSEAKILPKIPMVPLSAADASEILKRLDGPAVPKAWQGGLPFPYHAGGETVKGHLSLQMENRVTPIWDVIGGIPGSEEPEKLVILSNHHDAWVYGAVDPASGTAAMLETARALGQLVKEGFRPRRTILLGNWDAEEYTLTGSTEWGEQEEEELRKNAVICLNVDAATSGQDFSVSAVPALLPAIMEAAQAVRDPATGRSIYARWKEQRGASNVRSYAVGAAAAGPVPYGVLGGGSDFMVFLQHDGVPALDMLFDGPYGVYHSVYDDYAWMERFGDPGFRYHAAMSRLWGLLALRFANADLLPFDYSLYATEVAAYLQSLEKISPPDFFAAEIQPLIQKCRAWHDPAAQTTARLEAWRRGTSAVAALYERRPERRSPIASAQTLTAATGEINASLMNQERALLEEQGIPGRPWFRHLIYAPLPSYEAETLPGLREALEARDLARARDQAARLRQALDRAVAALLPGARTGK
jgi:N-acetylated-alpha-linked acidic dipeptidase